MRFKRNDTGKIELINPGTGGIETFSYPVDAREAIKKGFKTLDALSSMKNAAKERLIEEAASTVYKPEEVVSEDEFKSKKESKTPKMSLKTKSENITAGTEE